MNIADIRNLKPCYDPSEFLAEDWEGSILDFLKIEEIPSVDRLWVIFKLDILSDEVKELYKTHFISFVSASSLWAKSLAEAHRVERDTKDTDNPISRTDVYNQMVAYLIILLEEEQYSRCLARIWELMDAKPDSPEEDELKRLMEIVTGYEAIHYPME